MRALHKKERGMKYIVKFSNWLESDNVKLVLFVIASAFIIWIIGWV